MSSYRRRHVDRLAVIVAWAAITTAAFAGEAKEPATGKAHATSWTVGTPIVTYWAGPSLTDASVEQFAAGGWNLLWCSTEEELDLVHRHGLRGQFQHPLISPASLDDPEKKKLLDALIDRISKHPGLYSYFIIDEPPVSQFPSLARIVEYLRQRDPKHMAYINLFPTNATNEQLGTKGDPATAYREHVRQYIDIVKPSLISYDHYQFAARGDMEQYFLNLALIREYSLQANVPFLNIVQACSWMPARRAPNGNEMRYLVYTSLAYGAQGISYFVYWGRPGYRGGIITEDGQPTPLYEVLKTANREFAAIGLEVQSLRSLAAYHAGMQPPGVERLPDDAPFRPDPPVGPLQYKLFQPVKGLLLGYFGPGNGSQAPSKPTHCIVVNLDYKAELNPTIVGPSGVEVFDALKGTWSKAGGNRAALTLPPGGGRLIRLEQSQAPE